MTIRRGWQPGARVKKPVKYFGHNIIGSKREGYWFSAMGLDLQAKTISEAKDKIYRLEHAGMPRRKNPRGTGQPLSQFCCSQPHPDGRRHCAPKRLLEEGQFEARMSWLRNHYRKSHPKLFAKQVRKGVVTRKKMKASRQNKLVKVTVPWYKKPLLGILNPTRELSVPEKHQLKIAKRTLEMSDIGARIMGGPTKEEAREIIKRLTGKAAKNPSLGVLNPTRVGIYFGTDGIYKSIKGTFVIFARNRNFAWQKIRNLGLRYKSKGSFGYDTNIQPVWSGMKYAIDLIEKKKSKYYFHPTKDIYFFED